MTYDWTKPFDLEVALSGVLVGFPIEGSEWNLSNTGKLLSDNEGSSYRVIIQGITLQVDRTGKVINTYPKSDDYLGKTLKMVTAAFDTDCAVGDTVTRSSGQGSDLEHDANSVINILEPRDHFAMSALSMMMNNVKSPEAQDAATMLLYSRAAYRWAQAMMIAAADSRKGSYIGPDFDVEVSPGDLQSNTEKLLYNIALAMDKTGIAVRNAEDDQEKKIPFELDIKKVDGKEIHKGVPVIGSYTDNQGNTADPILLDIKKVDSKQIYQGLPIVGAGTTSGEVKPVLTKLDKDSEIKKILEITEMKKLTELTEVKKLAELTEIKKLSELTELKKLTEVTEIKAIPHVDIDSMPSVEIDGTPSVNVANSPTVEVSNMPSEPIEIEGTVSVDNFPTSE